jgi:hypothetical protein
MANLLSEDNASSGGEPVRICLACGRELEESLARLGSLRCHNCRDESAPLDQRWVDEWWRGGAKI